MGKGARTASVRAPIRHLTIQARKPLSTTSTPDFGCRAIAQLRDIGNAFLAMGDTATVLACWQAERWHIARMDDPGAVVREVLQ
jgi:hypothetical protein